MKDPSRLASARIVEFYASATPDHRGRSLTEILKWSDERLESVHDYIQWLFPLKERSGFNMNAPVLDEPTIQEFQSRPELKGKLRASFERMLEFYGLEILDDDPPIVRRARTFAERSGNWLTAGNHNHLRITRILKSLQTLGLKGEAAAFFTCLADIYHEESAKELTGVSVETFGFWQAAAHSKV